MLLNWVLPSSVVKKNPTSTRLFGQFRKMNPWPSWALPLADHKQICIFIAPAEFSELTNMEHFYHLSFSIWNCQLMSIQHTLVPAIPAKPQPPNTPGLLLDLWASSNAFLLSLLLGAGLSSGSADQHSTGQGRGKHQITGSEGPASCPDLAASQRKRINEVFT